MAGVHCAKCGHENVPGVIICARCDYIVDTSFLGADFDAPTREETWTQQRSSVEGSDFGGEAIMLGHPSSTPDGNDWEAFVSERSGSFLAAETAEIERHVEPVPVYMERSTQAMLDPDAVLRVCPGADVSSIALSPFEHQVLALIDGERPVARIRKKGALSMSDTKIALAMLVDRGLLELVGHARPALSLGDVEDERRTLAQVSSEQPSGARPRFHGKAAARARGKHVA
jgi:hypothetical protein